MNLWLLAPMGTTQIVTWLICVGNWATAPPRYQHRQKVDRVQPMTKRHLVSLCYQWKLSIFLKLIYVRFCFASNHNGTLTFILCKLLISTASLLILIFQTHLFQKTIHNIITIDTFPYLKGNVNQTAFETHNSSWHNRIESKKRPQNKLWR